MLYSFSCMLLNYVWHAIEVTPNELLNIINPSQCVVVSNSQQKEKHAISIKVQVLFIVDYLFHYIYVYIQVYIYLNDSW